IEQYSYNYHSCTAVNFRGNVMQHSQIVKNYWLMASETNIKSVRDLMLRSQEVKSLTEKSRQLKDLERSLHHCLPSMLADYCQIRSYQNSVLCLDAASGSAATQLRFIQHQLLPRLKKLNVFKDLERITIRVQA